MRIQGKAKKRMKPQVSPEMALHMTKDALAHLQEAAQKLRLAGIANTLERTRLAISSCKGAVRNREAWLHGPKLSYEQSHSYTRNAGRLLWLLPPGRLRR